MRVRVRVRPAQAGGLLQHLRHAGGSVWRGVEIHDGRLECPAANAAAAVVPGQPHARTRAVESCREETRSAGTGRGDARGQRSRLEQGEGVDQLRPLVFGELAAVSGDVRGGGVVIVEGLQETCWKGAEYLDSFCQMSNSTNCVAPRHLDTDKNEATCQYDLHTLDAWRCDVFLKSADGLVVLAYRKKFLIWRFRGRAEAMGTFPLEAQLTGGIQGEESISDRIILLVEL